MIDQPSIWDEQLDLTEKQRDLLPAVKFWLLEDHRRSTPLGFGWSKNLSGPKSMSRMVFQKFPAPATADDVLCILNKIVVRAKALHLVELPQVSSRIKRPKPKSPFARDAGSCLRRVRSMQLVLTRWVDACPETVPPEAAILSAALYGGLLNTACLLTLVRTLHAVYRASDGYYVDLSLPWNGEPDMEKRRWFMDPCTAALLFRLDTESLQRLRCPEPGQCSVRDDILKGRLWKAIKREIQLHVPEADRPPSLAQMLLDMQMVARVELPSVVAAYAMRQKVVSHSLRASAYQRLEAHGHLSYRLAQDSAPVSEPVRSLASDNGREEKYAQPPWMRSLRLAMEGRNQKKILAALNVLKFAPNVQHNWGKYIVGFAIKLFEGESVARKRSLAKSTIRTHVRIVCRRFIGLLPIESIETVNLEELVAAYGQALDNAIDVGQRRGVRLNLVRSLREFHTYLHTEHGIPAVSESEVFGTENGLPAVNANIVSYEEYLKIRRRLSTPDGTRREWLCRIEDLIFTLAFSCGLRRMEIFGLRLDDLRWFAREDGAKFDRQVELLIRPSTLRNLKTKNSTRRIPLDAFLPGQDLRAILDWKQQRTNRHRASRNDLLFHHPELATLKEPERTIIEHIHDAMREITGDPSLHLHHLRHSFATWTFFRLMMSDIANIPRILGLQTTTSQWLKKSKKLRLRLYGNEFPTRRHAYAVAKLLGHSSPDISLEHYIHCMDWLLATSLANSVILAPGKLTLDAASGKASRTARRWRSAKKNSDTIQNQDGAGGIAAADRLARRAPQESVALSGSQPSAQISQMERVERLLLRYEFDGISQGDLATEFLFPPSEVSALICRARTVQNRRSRRGVKGFVHQMKTTHRRRLCVPLKPHLPFSRSVAEEYFQRLTYLNDSNQTFDQVQEALDYYVSHIQSAHDSLLFRNVRKADGAKTYLNLLRALKIPTSCVKLLSYDSSSRSQYRAIWRKALALSHRRQIERAVLPSGNTSRSALWLGIKPSFSRPKGTADNDDGSTGFRYAMLLGYIAFGKIAASDDGS